MAIQKQSRIFRFQSNVDSVWDVETQQLQRDIKEFEVCPQMVCFEDTTGEIIASSSEPIISIHLETEKAETPRLKEIATLLNDILEQQVAPLIIEAFLLKKQYLAELANQTESIEA